MFFRNGFLADLLGAVSSGSGIMLLVATDNSLLSGHCPFLPKLQSPSWHKSNVLGRGTEFEVKDGFQTHNCCYITVGILKI